MIQAETIAGSGSGTPYEYFEARYDDSDKAQAAYLEYFLALKDAGA